jgi:replicative DNA helicase
VTALHLAEQATLGALMLDPQLPSRTAPWLRSEDFDRAWHGQVHAVIRELVVAGQRADARAVGALLLERHGAPAANLPGLVDLLQAAPAHPVGAHYAAVVLEGSLRRQVAAAGVLLKGAALATALASDPGPVQDACDRVEELIASAEHRYAAAVGTMRTLVPEPRVSMAVAPLWPSALAADRVLIEHPTPSTEEVTRREATLVAALIARPASVPSVSEWLRPEALTSQTWRPVYRAVLQLHGTGQVVDEVTVAWEVHRCSAIHGSGPSTPELRDAVAHAGPVSVAYAARMVAADQVRLTAERAAVALRVDAANPGLDLGDLLGTAGILTAA